jgi:hypothetical protein
MVFSSALHHLKEPDVVLALTTRHLRYGGLLLTVFDPTPRNRRAVGALRWLDYLAFNLTGQRRDPPAATGCRLQRIRNARLTGRHCDTNAFDLREENPGILADYRIEAGIDDHRFAEVLGRHGLEMICHERNAGARWTLTKILLGRARAVTAFGLLARRPDPARQHECEPRDQERAMSPLPSRRRS